MTIEIERRWLVSRPDIQTLPVTSKVDIHQYYLSNGIRARITSGKGTPRYELAIKKTVSDMTNEEVEVSVPEAIFKALVDSDQGATEITKTRHFIHNGQHTIHLDHFGGELWIAEVEMRTTKDDVEIPEWFGTEVTGNDNYRNYHMSRKVHR